MHNSVLITGAGGFIGSHVVERYLSLGRQVRALDIDLSRIQHVSDPALERVEGDFTDPEVQRKAVDGVDMVIHLASAHLEVNVPEDTYWKVNVHSLTGFLEACRSGGVQRFVHVSSVGVYGRVQRPPANEDSPCHPELPYERTKLEGEAQVKRFFEETRFPVVIVRPAWVYGPGCPRTEKLFRSIRGGSFFFVGDGTTLRHSVYIDDLLDALELAATQDAAIGRTYVIADDEPVTLRDLVGEISRLCNTTVPRLRLPVRLMTALGLLMEVAFRPLRREPPFSRRTLRFFTGNTAFDTSRARKELGFVPRYNIVDGLRAYSKWLGSGPQGMGHRGATR